MAYGGSAIPTMHLSGATLQGRYTVEKVLGHGGMGAVYLGRDNVLGGKRVALKAMRVDAGDDASREKALAQFRGEAQILAQLEHPNLVDVTDFFEAEGHAWLVMSLVDGKTLDALTVEAPGFLRIAQVLGWMDQVCDVLEYLHGHSPPVLFRDLKPGNVMLDARGRVRLIDFGIARLLEPQSVTSTAMRGTLTPGFAPVEQYGGATDPRTDVYALGATLYTLLTRVVPPVAVARLSREESLVPPSHHNAAISADLEAVILKMLAIHKEDRYPSAAAVREALRAVAASADSGLESGAPTVVPRRYCTCCGVTLAPGLTACTKCAPSGATTHPLPTTSAAGVPRSRLAVGVLAVAVLIAATLLLVGGRKAAPRLDLITEPMGARVRVDGTDRGVTPLSVQLAEGAHPVEIRKEFYATTRFTVAVSRGATGHLHYAVQPPQAIQDGNLTVKSGVAWLAVDLQRPQGTLVLKGLPDGCEVRIDRRSYGRNLVDGSRLRVHQGSHRLEVRHADYLTWHGGVEIREGTPAVVEVAMKSALGSLRIQSQPTGARVFVDGELRGKTPLRLDDVHAGSYVVRAEKVGFKSARAAASVLPHRDATVRLKLLHG